ncbi:aminopeptidase N [Amylibacter marinus]|uniref:Aminopeptidase N n=1 Tax=Amylibacter marinus TaxID=1475483 RepID=A0ABQ5VUJ2_9RHOB|nr:aminopeptidase N [Amylibacter marinus]GLQ34847.1 aminopeptidase N [Amylibacter marinus]
MRPSTPPTIRLVDYQQPAFWIEKVNLKFALHPTATKVTSEITFHANADRGDGPHDLRLDGRDLKLIHASIDGRDLADDEVLCDAEGLSVPADLVPQEGFTWRCTVEINPEGNTALEGLYMSNGMYCTQCEAQGFRKITYYLDRPDVMARFNVKIEGEAPVLLSNGNKINHGSWQDPWPKPAYLFALVAGELEVVEDQFTTRSGRDVVLQIFVRKGDEDKCDYAMDALKRSMRWDEEHYGREYDLDLFMIVAVDDFNMGAMENKGLNIFNSRLVLATPETATDANYKAIEAVIAHEYFHNWTGNRITCRDWFQLCLKEGLTVFRDQKFSGDMRSHSVQRIEDVLTLRARQFPEDAGPLSHPVRPEEYIEINNFYTATVYEKGAEVIGMLKRLVGDETYRAACDLYFERHDGQACTIEDWIRVFEDVSGQDLTQFKLWYQQNGTPVVSVDEDFSQGTYRLTLRQDADASGHRIDKAAQVIPVMTGFLDTDGSEPLPEQCLILDAAEKTFVFEGLTAKPVVSLLRGFSAPVILDHTMDSDQRMFLFKHDSDTFNKWEAGRGIALDLLCDMARGQLVKGANFADALRTIALDGALDPNFRALMLTLPSEDAIAVHMGHLGAVPDPEAIHRARHDLKKTIAKQLASDLPELFAAMRVRGPYSPDADAAGRRALRLAALGLLSLLDDCAAAQDLYWGADNMTEQFAALSILISAGKGADAIDAFYKQWKDEGLVLDKWFAIQAGTTPPEAALDVVRALGEHGDFNWKNPNRFRSLIGGFATAPASFHRADGRGYEFVADWLIKLDALNPQTTARMCGVFGTWKRYDKKRQTLISTQLRRIQKTPTLSKDTGEIIGKLLAG